MRSYLAAAMAMGAALIFGLPATRAQAAMSAPVTAEGASTGQGLTEQVQWRRGHGYRRGYYRPGRFYRPWRPYYRPVYYRPYYAAPVYYGPRTVCRVRNRQVWNGWAYVWRPVRVCWRRW